MTNFIDPAPIWAQVKEELSSYFDSGSVDDALFPIWTSQAMSRFYKSALQIKQEVIHIDGFMADLPCDFDSVRAVWACGVAYSKVVPNPSSYYYQKDCRITEIYDRCNECFEEPEIDCCDHCSPNHPSQTKNYRVTHKVTGETLFNYRFSHLLKPTSQNKLGLGCENNYVDCTDEFDIKDNKIVTSFRDGTLHLIYYSNSDGEVLIPDNYFIKDFLMKQIKFKLFEQISNQVTDETFNQIQSKLAYYENQKNIAFVTASTELKKWDIYQIHDNVKRTNRKLNVYKRTLR